MVLCLVLILEQTIFLSCSRSHRGHDHMVVGFTTTYASSAYHH